MLLTPHEVSLSANLYDLGAGENVLHSIFFSKLLSVLKYLFMEALLEAIQFVGSSCKVL